MSRRLPVAKQPVSAREAEEQHLIGVLQELHEDDLEGGYRVLADDLHDLGYQVSERRVWRLCKVAGIQSVIAKRKRRYQKAGEPVGMTWWGVISPQMLSTRSG